MKIFVCFKSWNQEGCSIPLAIFDNEEAAKLWCKENNPYGGDAEYEELVLNEKQ